LAKYSRREKLRIGRPSCKDSKERWEVYRIIIARNNLRKNRALLHNTHQMHKIILKYGTNPILLLIYLRYRGTKTRYKNFFKRMNIT
jgi:hypothetical protein